METEKKIRRLKSKIFIVDDHPIVQEYLSQLINHQRDLTVCGVADSVTTALSSIQSDPPDLAIVDINLRESSGINLIKDLKAILPHLPILVISMHDEPLYAERALRAGALGYIRKQAPTTEIMAAIRQVLSGERYMSKELAERLAGKAIAGGPSISKSPTDSLTNRELEVLQMLGQGRGSREIAATLNLSIKTIEVYRDRIKQKLNLKDAAELIHYAITWVNDQNIK